MPRSSSERRFSNRSPRLYQINRDLEVIDSWALGSIPSISYPLFIVSEHSGFEREAGPLGKLWAAICSVFGWRCLCPKCGGTMKREIATDESYRRSKRVGLPAGSARMSGQFATLRSSGSAYRQVEITPTYDVCTECGHRIRRRNLKTTVG